MRAGVGITQVKQRLATAAPWHHPSDPAFCGLKWSSSAGDLCRPNLPVEHHERLSVPLKTIDLAESDVIEGSARDFTG